jgi:ubiquinone/menaquinone biosynthesis C-methylase UbiE
MSGCDDMAASSRPEIAWSRLANRWDTSGTAWNRPVAERLVQLTGLGPGMSVLDAGCGAGAATVPAARAVSPGGMVTGVDSAAAMIVRARREAAEAGVRNAIFACEDASALPYPASSFDAVISSLVVTYLPQPARALHGWHYLLRPGGTLAFSWVQAEDPAWNAVFEAVDEFVTPDRRWLRMVQRWGVADAENLLPPGLEVSTTTEPVTTCYTSMDHWWQSCWTQAPALAWSHIPPLAREEARRAAFAGLAGLTTRDGRLDRTRAVSYTIARPAGQGP